MNKILQSSLIGFGGLVIGSAGFYLSSLAQTDTDSVTGTITIPSTVTITDDGVNFSIANLTPGVVDSTQDNALTVASNSSTGFNVTVSAADLAAVAGQFCADSTPNNGTCDVSGNVFDTDNGTGLTGSRLSVTSTNGTGALNTLAGAAFLTSDTNLGSTPVQVYTTTARTNEADLNVLYKAFADFLVAADTYKGNLTFTISAQ